MICTSIVRKLPCTFFFLRNTWERGFRRTCQKHILAMEIKDTYISQSAHYVLSLSENQILQKNYDIVEHLPAKEFFACSIEVTSYKHS